LGKKKKASLKNVRGEVRAGLSWEMERNREEKKGDNRKQNSLIIKVKGKEGRKNKNPCDKRELVPQTKRLTGQGIKGQEEDLEHFREKTTKAAGHRKPPRRQKHLPSVF